MAPATPDKAQSGRPSDAEHGQQSKCQPGAFPLDLVLLLLGFVEQSDRLQHAALACKLWNAAACSLCSSVTATFCGKKAVSGGAGFTSAQVPGTWCSLAKAFYTKQWLCAHGRNVTSLDLNSGCMKEGNFQEPCVEINVPVASLVNLQKLKLAGIDMPLASWAQLASRTGPSSTIARRGQNCEHLTSLTLANCPKNLTHIQAVQLAGLQKLELNEWDGTAADLTAALASSRASLTELQLVQCCILSFVDRATIQGVGFKSAEDVAATRSLVSVLQALPHLAVLGLSSVDASFTMSEPTSSAGQETMAAGDTSYSQAATMAGNMQHLPQLRDLTLDNPFGLNDLPLLHLLSCCPLSRLALGIHETHAPVYMPEVLKFMNLRHCDVHLVPPAYECQRSISSLSALGRLQHLTHLDLSVPDFLPNDVLSVLNEAPAALPNLQSMTLTASPSSNLLTLPSSSANSSPRSSDTLSHDATWHMTAQDGQITSQTLLVCRYMHAMEDQLFQHTSCAWHERQK